MKRSNWLAAGCLLCAAETWAAPVPSGAMADYYLHCNWAGTHSEARCATLADRLAALESPSRDERLALLLSRQSQPGRRAEPPLAGEVCAGLRTIVEDHPDYATAMSRLALHYCVDRKESVALLRRALEIEPDNHDALSLLVFWADRFSGDEWISEIGPQTLAAYREALYEAARERDAWAAAVSKNVHPRWMWGNSLNAAGYSVKAALRDGDLDAAGAMRARVRRDTGLDDLDYSVEENVLLACKRIDILEEVCVSAVEQLAEHASAEGIPLPGTLLAVVENATDRLRRHACAETLGQDPGTFIAPLGDECRGVAATESPAVRRLRAVLEHHGGAWSSEHHRVHAQGFLGDVARRDGLRAALRADPENAQARCDLARALADLGDPGAADVLGEGSDPSCLESRKRVWGDSIRGLGDTEDSGTHAITIPSDRRTSAPIRPNAPQIPDTRPRSRTHAIPFPRL